MPFTEHLKKKLHIDHLARRVLQSIGPAGGSRKVDKDAMRSLLDYGGYAHQYKRDLDLFVKSGEGQAKPLILVLDNDLPIYRTTVEDVVLRKSPFVKEMISIRNTIKILNDSDVVISKKAASVERIHQEIVSGIELAFSAADLEDIRRDGIVSLESGDAAGVQQDLIFFGEVLGFKPAPRPIAVQGFFIAGEHAFNERGELCFGPAVLFSAAANELKAVMHAAVVSRREAVESFRKVAYGDEPAAKTGGDVFRLLREMASHVHVDDFVKRQHDTISELTDGLTF